MQLNGSPALPNLDQANSLLTDSVLTLIQSTMHRQPQFLWHYTSADGLLGIINHKEIWMSHITCMNDSEEYLHGQKYLIEAMSIRLRDDNLPAHLNDLYGTLMSPVIRSMNLDSVPAIFVACFSGETDTLTHWIEYGQHGVGYALGFDTENLKSVLPPNVVLMRCIYNDEEKTKMLLETLKAGEEILENLISRNPSVPPAMMVAHFVPVLCDATVIFGTFFKHAIFEPEQEWRLISFGAQPIYVSRRNEVRELIKLSLVNNQKIPLSEIKIGSNRDERLREISATVIKRYLKSKSLEHVNVVQSKSPYRST